MEALMHRRFVLRVVRAAAVIAAAVASPVTSGAQGGMGAMAHPNEGAFTVGGTDGWTIGVPHLDISGGLYSVMAKGSLPKVNEGFVSFRYQTGLGTEHFQLSGTALFVPKLGGSPQATTLFQFVPTKNDSKAYASLGAGVISGRWGSGNRVEPWAQAVIGWKTVIHDLAPFVQVGMPLVEGSRAEWYFGASHPLAPYRFHLP
jgi:hypothetical protein